MTLASVGSNSRQRNGDPTDDNPPATSGNKPVTVLRITIEIIPASGGPPQIVDVVRVANVDAGSAVSAYSAEWIHEGETVNAPADAHIVEHRHANGAFVLASSVMSMLASRYGHMLRSTNRTGAG